LLRKRLPVERINDFFSSLDKNYESDDDDTDADTDDVLENVGKNGEWKVSYFNWSEKKNVLLLTFSRKLCLAKMLPAWKRENAIVKGRERE